MTKDTQPENYHVPIMLNECIEGLNIKPNGVYVDCTFGGGGHSKFILEQLNFEGKLIAFDQDEDVQKHLLADKRFQFFPNNFAYIKNFLRWRGFEKVDGILADLGVSSHQIDTPNRGFSVKNDEEKLDMRMDQRNEKTAVEVLNNYSQEQLADLIFNFGEVPNSRKIAAKIVEARKVKRIETLVQLKQIIQKNFIGNEQKNLIKIFQAIRIEVNGELEALKKMLLQSIDLLNLNGRLVVMSFHSLEDRLVKKIMKNEAWSSDERLEKESFLMLTKKPITASNTEIKKNKRSASAKLRIAQRVIL